MIQKRKSSPSCQQSIPMLRTLPSQYHNVADAKLRLLGDMSGHHFKKYRNLYNNKHLRLGVVNPMAEIESRITLSNLHSITLITISIRYFPAETLVTADRNIEKIPVSVVYSIQTLGEEMPVPLTSTSALIFEGVTFAYEPESAPGREFNTCRQQKRSQSKQYR